MRLMEYRKLRDGVQLNAAPGTADEAHMTAVELRRALLASGCFADVEVDTSENLDHLVVAMCSYNADVTDEDAALALEDIWNGRLRFGYWAVHSTLVTRGQVELQGATLVDLGGPYVTVHVVAQRPTVPVQRSASD